MKQILRDVAYYVTKKHIDERKLEYCTIKVSRKDLSFFGMSTNKILSFEYEGKVFYFRECVRLVESKVYWKRAIDEFFDSLDRISVRREHFAQQLPIITTFSEVEITTFRAYLESRIKEKKFCGILRNIDKISQKIKFSIWEKVQDNNLLFERFNMQNVPTDCSNIAIYFLWNMRSVADQYRKQNIVCGKTYSFFGASKAISSQIVAQEFGLTEMITLSMWCKLYVDDEAEYFGLLSHAAPGHRMIDSDILPTGKIQKELLCLNVLDVICNQPDHGPNNYSFNACSGEGISICAFDNDNSQTFFPWMSIKRKLSGCDPIVDKRGYINRPYFDMELFNKLINVDFKKITKLLNPYLNIIQILALCCRIKYIRKAINKTVKIRPDFLLSSSEWNEATVAKELSGWCKNTYFTKAFKA